MSEHPPVKRKRVTKACLACAKSRRKCDGVQPVCGTCRAQGVQCGWSDAPSRRGPPKGYRRGSADPQSLHPKIAKIREQVQALQYAYGEAIVMREIEEVLFGSIYHCAVKQEGLSKLDSNSELTADDDADDRSTSDVDEGSSSGLAFLALATSMRLQSGAQSTNDRLDAMSPDDEKPKYSPWAVHEVPVHSDWRCKGQIVGGPRIPEPGPAEVELLLKTYWSSIHPHWPILYKPAFDAISLFSISAEIPRSLLYAIYALASHLAPSPSFSTGMSETFFRIAQEEVLRGCLRSDIDTCTALFLLSLHYHGEGNQRQAWVLCGLAAMMALDLGLHKAAPKLPIDDHERRVRVFWNIFVYEKVLAAEMGRPVTLRMVHCDPTRLSEDEPDEYETVVHPGSGLAVRLYTMSIFNAAVDLFRTFERILSEVHSVAPAAAATRSARERLVQELDHDLERWQSTLPLRCAYPRPDDKQPTRTRYLTHAWYLVAMILLHRPLIPRFRAGQPFVGNIHHMKATNAANSLVDLLAQFAAGQEIDKLPPNDAYLIFTAAILHIFNLGLENRALREAARPRLEQCLEWLKGLAETWPAASSHKKLLDAFSQAASNTMSRTLAPAGPPYVVSGPFTSAGTVPYMLPQDHGLLHPPPMDPEQKLSTPELFSLENLYWNDFQAVEMGQLGELYGQTGELSQSHGSVYHDVLRLLEDGRTVV